MKYIKAVKPLKLSFIIDSVISAYSHTVVTSTHQLHSDCFLADMLFTIAYSANYHGRNITSESVYQQLVYIGKQHKLERMLYAWNKDRENMEDSCPVIILNYPSLADLKTILIELYEKTAKPIMLFIESNAGFNPYLNSRDLLEFLKTDLETSIQLTSISGIDSAVPEIVAKTLYESDIHIHLEHNPLEGIVIVNFMKQVFNDLPAKFGFAKKNIDNIMVFTDSNILDDSTIILFTYTNNMKKKPIRIIDVLAALNGRKGWPTLGETAKTLDVIPSCMDTILKKVQNMGYIDRYTSSFTAKGRHALRNHSITILAK